MGETHRGGSSDQPGAYRLLAGQRGRLDRRGRGEHVAELVRNAVLAGDFAPGVRLGEPEICDALGVSRNTLREAFRILVEDRVAEHRLHRGVFVRIPTPAEVADLYTCRRVVECAAVRSYRPGGLGLDAVRAAVALAGIRASAGDWTGVGAADIDFHRALVALHGSPRLDGFMATTWHELRLVFHVMGDAQSFHGPYLERNQALTDHLVAGEIGLAEKQLATYLDDAEAQILAHYPVPR